MNCIIAKSLENHESVANDKLSRERRSVQICFKAPLCYERLVAQVCLVCLVEEDQLDEQNKPDKPQTKRTAFSSSLLRAIGGESFGEAMGKSYHAG